MSKSELLKNISWETNRFKVQMLIERPKNKGIITPEEAEKLNGELKIFEYGSLETGMMLKLYWVYDKSQERVISARYTIFGPPPLLAIADMAALLCRNKTYDEISKINYKSLEYFLRDNPVDSAMPKEYNYAVIFVLKALENAVKTFKGEEIEYSPVVCSCAGVKKSDIEYVIKEFDLESIEDIGNYTRAGRFCGSCIAPGEGYEIRPYYLKDILKETREAIEEEKGSSPQMSDKPFKDMTLEEKKDAINATIDKYIRAMLVMDGGDMEILDIKENGEHTDIYIRYLGACSGCASASTGTLFAIEGILKQKLDPNIRVLPL